MGPEFRMRNFAHAQFVGPIHSLPGSHLQLGGVIMRRSSLLVFIGDAARLSNLLL